jgi:hypothetical protein
MGLDRYHEVVGLGGKEYHAAIEAAFEGTGPRLSSRSPGCRSARRCAPRSGPRSGDREVPSLARLDIG